MVFKINCNCGDPQCTGMMEISEKFDEEDKIEIVIYTEDIPSSIYLNKDDVIDLRKKLAMILMGISEEDELGFC